MVEHRHIVKVTVKLYCRIVNLSQLDYHLVMQYSHIALLASMPRKQKNTHQLFAFFHALSKIQLGRSMCINDNNRIDKEQYWISNIDSEQQNH